jgi:hypothetical protein
MWKTDTNINTTSYTYTYLHTYTEHVSNSATVRGDEARRERKRK